MTLATALAVTLPSRSLNQSSVRWRSAIDRLRCLGIGFGLRARRQLVLQLTDHGLRLARGKVGQRLDLVGIEDQAFLIAAHGLAKLLDQQKVGVSHLARRLFRRLPRTGYGVAVVIFDRHAECGYERVAAGISKG